MGLRNTAGRWRRLWGTRGAPTPCSRARLATRPGCLPGEAGSIPVESASRRSSVDERHAPTVEARGFDSSRRDCVARLVASPRAVTPWSGVRFPGDACLCSRAGIHRVDSCRSDPRLRRGRPLKASPFGAATAAKRNHRVRERPLPRRRAGWEGAALIRRSRVVRFHGRRLDGQLAVGELGHPAGFGNRRPLVRLQPARLAR